MTERVSQEAVEAANDAFWSCERWDVGDPRVMEVALQAALPALEADLRERLAQEFEKRAEIVRAEISGLKDRLGPEAPVAPRNAEVAVLEEAANLARTFGTTEEEPCERCGGSGANDVWDTGDTIIKTGRCPDCNGTCAKPDCKPDPSYTLGEVRERLTDEDVVRAAANGAAYLDPDLTTAEADLRAQRSLEAARDAAFPPSSKEERHG